MQYDEKGLQYELPELVNEPKTVQERLQVITTAQDWLKDSQANKLYFAEDLAEQSLGSYPMLGILAANKLVQSVQRSSWMQEHYPRYYHGELTKVVLLTDDVNEVNSYGVILARTSLTTWDIQIPRSGASKFSLLHELSHVIMYHQYGIRRVASCVEGHGPEFAKVNLEVMKEYLGLDLIGYYNRVGVDFTSEPWRNCHNV